jgi:hypothetical protein
MSKIGPLAPGVAKTTLAARFGPLADRLRQLNTKFGIRPYRVFLNWTRFSGDARGAGSETLVQRTEILPTPKVASLDSTTFSMFHAGTVPVGSVKISEISVSSYTEDILRGLDPNAIPAFSQMVPQGQVSLLDTGIPQPFDFFWEVVMDDRGGENPVRFRYRLLNKPFLLAGSVMWTVMLEKTSEDRLRSDASVFGIPGRL